MSGKFHILPFVIKASGVCLSRDYGSRQHRFVSVENTRTFWQKRPHFRRPCIIIIIIIIRQPLCPVVGRRAGMRHSNLLHFVPKHPKIISQISQKLVEYRSRNLAKTDRPHVVQICILGICCNGITFDFSEMLQVKFDMSPILKCTNKATAYNKCYKVVNKQNRHE